MNAICALPAPAPVGVRRTDYVVVGSGLAGMTTALLLSERGRVDVLTKGDLISGSTPLAQGGIAAAIAPDDDTGEHRDDTVACGAGLTDAEAAQTITDFGPQALTWLIRTGVEFDRDAGGRLELGREGGHHGRRIARAGGAATGAFIAKALAQAVRSRPRVHAVSHAFLLDLLPDAEARVVGVSYVVGGQVRWLLARAVILATGGFASAYAVSTNPDLLTADGVAAALRAGAQVADLEFVQFHPTVLRTGGSGRLPLISEAVRGEGATLLDGDGRRFMIDAHPMADLAPRDVVSRTAALRMRQSSAGEVFLDARHLGEAVWNRRFPTIRNSCRAHGLDPVTDLLPVAPAAHYCCGGIVTDLTGRTSLPGLYACGEVARTGLHGANRLASNSLLEAVALAHAVANQAAVEAMPTTDVAPAPDGPIVDGAARSRLGELMLAGCGVLRTEDDLAATLSSLDNLAAPPPTAAAQPTIADWEATNLHTLAMAVALCARQRRESRGCHYRADFPDPQDRCRRSTVCLEAAGLRVRTAGDHHTQRGTL